MPGNRNHTKGWDRDNVLLLNMNEREQSEREEEFV